MGRIYPGSLDVERYSLLDSLHPGTMSEPVRLDSGNWALYKVVERHPEHIKPLSEVRQRVESSLRDQRRSAVFRALDTKASSVIPSKIRLDRIQSADEETIVARIDTIDLTVGDVKRALESLEPSHRDQLSSTEGLRQFVESLYRRTLYHEFAQRDPDFQQRHGRFVRYLGYEKLAQYYVQQVVRPKAEPSDDDLRRAYDEDQSRFTVKHPYLRTRHAFFGAVQGTHEAVTKARESSEEAIRQLHTGVPLENLVRTKSQDRLTRNQGGETEWFSRGVGRYDETYYEAAVSLAPGQITTSPVRTTQGWYVIQLLERSSRQPYELVVSSLAAQLGQSRGRELINEIVERERASRGLRINEPLVERLGEAPGRP